MRRILVHLPQCYRIKDIRVIEKKKIYEYVSIWTLPCLIAQMAWGKLCSTPTACGYYYFYSQILFA